MDARVGAAGARGFNLAAEQQLKRMFQLALHRKLAGLARKTAERLAIVGDGKRKRHIVFDIIHIEHDTSFAREHDKQ